MRATRFYDILAVSKVQPICREPSTGRYTALTVLADSGLLIAAVNRGDRYHTWATRHLLAARRRSTKIAVPDLVVGEAFTKLRYDKRVSPRNDANIAMMVFGLVDSAPELFELRSVDGGTYQKTRDVLAKYIDQSFSYVDAVIFSIVDDDPSINQVLTIDGRDFTVYRFRHTVEIVLP